MYRRNTKIIILVLRCIPHAAMPQTPSTKTSGVSPNTTVAMQRCSIIASCRLSKAQLDAFGDFRQPREVSQTQTQDILPGDVLTSAAWKAVRVRVEPDGFGNWHGFPLVRGRLRPGAALVATPSGASNSCCCATRFCQRWVTGKRSPLVEVPCGT